MKYKYINATKYKYINAMKYKYINATNLSNYELIFYLIKLSNLFYRII